MGIKIMKIAFAAILLLLSVSCTQGHCRRKQDVQGVAVPVAQNEATEAIKAASERPSDRVMVYKYDGSLQCKGGKVVAPEVMAKELAGVQIFSSIKKPDGLMHIQVCGSITGMANVYEISLKDLKKAEARGFKKWDFQ